MNKFEKAEEFNKTVGEGWLKSLAVATFETPSTPRRFATYAVRQLSIEEKAELYDLFEAHFQRQPRPLEPGENIGSVVLTQDQADIMEVTKAAEPGEQSPEAG